MRGELPISRSYVANWRNTSTRVRGLPLTRLMVTGLVGLAYMVGRPDLAAIFLLGFKGLLRSDEMVGLRFSMTLSSPSESKLIMLLQGKLGVRNNVTE